ncbi:hypothetical protein A3844_06075 [Paenibacillus helianthi]|uniref:Uncharacterized protein n=1 Tax=Paenibacillus helianthi TaxID=1349432 RepID=A0ABX3EUC5_9BACL|nr:hypothetical protein [Paenibacillus helianthi]OKP89546.1 hypothetical protein A3844_06075 [Paenibacillus helianthi]
MANFAYIEKITTSQELLDTLKTEITAITNYPHNATAGETPTANTWVVAKEVVDTASGKIKELTLEGTSKIGATTKKFHVVFTHQGFTTASEHSSLTVQVKEGWNETKNSYANEGHPINFEWANEAFLVGGKPTDRTITKPVYLYMNVMNNRLALVVVGDPAVHFDDYRKSFLYVGALKPFQYNQDDVSGNIMVTAGAVKVEPTTPMAGFDFGQYTSFGNNTLQMFQTKSGIKFQKHYPAFITQAPTTGKAFVDTQIGDTGLLLEPQGFNASSWTRKYHLSPIYVVHAYDGYRGQLDSCIAVSKNNILHLDELIVDIPEKTEGKAWKQEVYRYFDHNTEQNFMNRSANVKMGIAILKEVRY